MNIVVDGNYMFLQRKPVNGSLLDYLGPYPWYIVTLELVSFLIFFILWILFRNKTGDSLKNYEKEIFSELLHSIFW